MLNRAFGHVMDGAELIALQKNRYWLTPDGLALDVGPFVAALEYATRRDALVVGKPSKDFFATILAGIPARAGRGRDGRRRRRERHRRRPRTPGLAGILVRTGKYREDALRDSGVEPAAVVDSIADVPALLGG